MPETTALVHDDLSKENVLVDEDGNLTAIIDWECVSAFPLWKVCQLPLLLEGRDRTEKPFKDGYFVDENGEVDEIFWEHLLEYEQTQLRTAFLNEMQRIEPTWIETYSDRSNERKADIELVVHHGGNEFCIKRLGKWLDEFRVRGNVSRLKKLLQER